MEGWNHLQFNVQVNKVKLVKKYVSPCALPVFLQGGGGFAAGIFRRGIFRVPKFPTQFSGRCAKYTRFEI